ncbi:MAG TPA: NAD(P)H-binding protein [Rhizomicrobium sp.]|nr:NAD(P)H-binding protein [Rhizomicrobium sp.]
MWPGPTVYTSDAPQIHRPRRWKRQDHMKIGIIGASGNIGSRIHVEATARGHDVAAFTRSAAAAKGAPWRDLDVFDLDALSAVVASVDVVVSAYHPGNSARDIGDALQRAIADPTAYARVAKNLVKALERRVATPATVVGGAANLEIAPGVTTDDDDDRLRQVFRSIGVPEAYAKAAKGHRDALNVLRLSNRPWTYASPSAEVYASARTGRFRTAATSSSSTAPAGATSPTKTSRSPSSTKSKSPGTSSTVGLLNSGGRLKASPCSRKRDESSS